MSRRQLERGTPLRGMATDHGSRPLPSDLGAESVPDHGCGVLHVDMDAFFASVEQLERPEARGQPVLVGGTGPRGVVASANYAARAYGIHSAMPMSQARRLCPRALVYPADHERYSQVSAAVRVILESVTPVVEPVSLDEAFLDVSGARARLGGPVWIAEHLRSRIRAEQGLTCSVGIAPNKFVAKLAATHAKPDGVYLVPEAQVQAFLHPLPVGALWGVGPKVEQRLVRLGLHTIADVAAVSPASLRREVGPALGDHLAALARGRDERAVQPASSAEERGLSAECTFARDVADAAVIDRELLRLSERLARRLRTEGQGHAARTVTLKVRRADFTTITRSRTLPEPTDLAREIHATARILYEAAEVSRARLRLVGIRVEGLVVSTQAHRQLTLDATAPDWRGVEQVMDEASRRFGDFALRPASLAQPTGDPAPSGQRSHPGARGHDVPERW
ncbi:DNA polymerase IV [Lipingzhangella sp. LS1_29]|uniref:DNA polymerase IV n=1 Tax=Lipingzhangella rawalii TaxID=2055835 RepID=A0ABU2H281_9ACTN|nr:DNA polymerase IV [Lipingzhangella rawalii]MDS1269412.1 DNA polymerase IV [Lipingzhangella rawalii]